MEGFLGLEEVEQVKHLCVNRRSKFVENDEVHPRQMLGKSALVPLRILVSSRLTRSTTL